MNVRIVSVGIMDRALPIPWELLIVTIVESLRDLSLLAVPWSVGTRSLHWHILRLIELLPAGLGRLDEAQLGQEVEDQG